MTRDARMSSWSKPCSYCPSSVPSGSTLSGFRLMFRSAQRPRRFDHRRISRFHADRRGACSHVGLFYLRQLDRPLFDLHRELNGVVYNFAPPGDIAGLAVATETVNGFCGVGPAGALAVPRLFRVASACLSIPCIPRPVHLLTLLSLRTEASSR